MLQNSEKQLRERCHVDSNAEGDSFVGVRVDTENAVVCFPIGYQLPDDDDELRVDVSNLLLVLSSFMKEDRIIEHADQDDVSAVAFPMHAYLTIIRDYLRTGRYYKEIEKRYVTDAKGKTNWARTARDQIGLIQENGSLIFSQRTVIKNTPKDNEMITQIHMYCVHKAFEKLGWIYVSFVPRAPEVYPGLKQSAYILRKKLAYTNNDVEHRLFEAMLKLLEYEDVAGNEKEFFYGTYHFETVWENMIDLAFGVPDKDQYFPKAHWLLDYGPIKQKKPLQPDSIMIYNGKYYVLDAKLYKYGWTANADDLPNSSDINKQITYGEFVERKKRIPNERLFNAFIMPYNKKKNHFNFDSNFGNIGEAIGDWRKNEKNYERIQGIVVDTRYLMYNYIGTPEEQKRELAECIEKVLEREPVSIAGGLS